MLSTINKLALRLPKASELIASRPLRIILRWQVYATVVLAVIAAGWMGKHGAISVLLGGLVMVNGECVSAIMISSRKVKTTGQTLRTLIRAEALKVALIVSQLWIGLTTYHEIVAPVFIATFVVTVLIYPAALLVRD